jgi:hypothetical protein
MKQTCKTPKNEEPKKNVLQYLSPEKVYLNLPFIYCENKILYIGMPYLKTENWLADSKIDAVRLLDISDSEEIVSVKVQSLTTFEVTTLSWNLESTSKVWLWSIASLNYLITLPKINR